MRPATVGPALGEAACHAEEAFRALVRMALRLDGADIVVTEEVGQVIEAVADMSAGLLQLADDFGRAQVARRRAA
jgi:hypothetical protein